MKLNFTKFITVYLVSMCFSLAFLLMFQLSPVVCGLLGGLVAAVLCPNPIEEKKK